jgi:hypothetical protein
MSLVSSLSPVSSYRFPVGMFVDCFDLTQNTFFPAVIKDINSQGILVHYEGWSDLYDEIIPWKTEKSRIAALYSYSNPLADQSESNCTICYAGGELLLCDHCPRVFHLSCLKPPLTAPPEEGEWLCFYCQSSIPYPTPLETKKGEKTKSHEISSEKQSKSSEQSKSKAKLKVQVQSSVKRKRSASRHSNHSKLPSSHFLLDLSVSNPEQSILLLPSHESCHEIDPFTCKPPYFTSIFRNDSVIRSAILTLPKTDLAAIFYLDCPVIPHFTQLRKQLLYSIRTSIDERAKRVKQIAVTLKERDKLWSERLQSASRLVNDYCIQLNEVQLEMERRGKINVRLLGLDSASYRIPKLQTGYQPFRWPHEIRYGHLSHIELQQELNRLESCKLSAYKQLDELKNREHDEWPHSLQCEAADIDPTSLNEWYIKKCKSALLALKCQEFIEQLRWINGWNEEEKSAIKRLKELIPSLPRVYFYPTALDEPRRSKRDRKSIRSEEIDQAEIPQRLPRRESSHQPSNKILPTKAYITPGGPEDLPDQQNNESSLALSPGAPNIPGSHSLIPKLSTDEQAIRDKERQRERSKRKSQKQKELRLLLKQQKQAKKRMEIECRNQKAQEKDKEKEKQKEKQKENEKESNKDPEEKSQENENEKINNNKESQSISHSPMNPVSNPKSQPSAALGVAVASSSSSSVLPQLQPQYHLKHNIEPMMDLIQTFKQRNLQLFHSFLNSKPSVPSLSSVVSSPGSSQLPPLLQPLTASNIVQSHIELPNPDKVNDSSTILTPSQSAPPSDSAPSHASPPSNSQNAPFASSRWARASNHPKVSQFSIPPPSVIIQNKKSIAITLPANLTSEQLREITPSSRPPGAKSGWSKKNSVDFEHKIASSSLPPMSQTISVNENQFENIPSDSASASVSMEVQSDIHPLIQSSISVHSSV